LACWFTTQARTTEENCTSNVLPVHALSYLIVATRVVEGTRTGRHLAMPAGSFIALLAEHSVVERSVCESALSLSAQAYLP
jgi:hypothetical protein